MLVPNKVFIRIHISSIDVRIDAAGLRHGKHFDIQALVSTWVHREMAENLTVSMSIRLVVVVYFSV